MENKTPNGTAYSTPIADLDLSVRAYNCLKASDFVTVEDLIKLAPEDVMTFRNFGRKCLIEIEAIREELGVPL